MKKWNLKTYINDIRQVIHKIFMYGCIAGVHAQQVIISSFQSFKFGVIVFQPALEENISINLD